MWKIPHSEHTHPINVIPTRFKDDWEDTMNNWGSTLLNVVFNVTSIIESELGLQLGAFTDLLQGGSHVLAPTGVNVDEYNKVGTVYAGYHKDISFFTIHGKSRYPGLYVWLRNGKKIPVKIPNGYLLLQVGEQLEWVTGGYFHAGYHEVICDENTVTALQNASNHSKSKWRVSSTLFAHVNLNKYLYPHIETPNSQVYPKIKASDYIEKELKKIKLGI